MKQSNTRRPVLFYAGILLFFVMLTSSITSGLYARYAAHTTGNDTARVAKFVFNTVDENLTELIDLSSVQNPGDSATYTFKVTNTDGISVCEVAQGYTVTVEITGNMPLLCTLTKNGVESDSLNTALFPDRTLTLSGELIAGSEDGDQFALTVTWPSEFNDASLSGGAALSAVSLHVVSEQLD